MKSEKNKLEYGNYGMSEPSASFRYAFPNAENGLFKYRFYDTEQNQDRVRRMLKHGEIYFSSRSELNDPFELRVSLSPPANKKVAVKALLKTIQRGGKRGGATAKQVMEAQTRMKRQNPTAIYSLIQQQHNERLAKDCFVFCLSGDRTNPLLWSHYADAHKGVCLHFDDKTIPFAASCAVTYSERFPESNYPAPDSDKDDLFKKSILTKSRHWAYENEFRLFSVRMGNKGADLALPWITPQLARVNRKSIKGITIGACMAEELRSDLIAFCKLERPDMEISVAKTSADRYALEFSQVP